MKKNKEIKKGDKIWLNSVYLSYASHHIVKSVKKKGTLVEVVVDAELYNKEYEVVMYGHASSSILSGYDRRFGNQDACYTCDYAIIERKTKYRQSFENERNIGQAVLNLMKHLKRDNSL